MEAGDRRIQRSVHGKLRFPTARERGSRSDAACVRNHARGEAKASGDTTVGSAGGGHLRKRSSSSVGESPPEATARAERRRSSRKKLSSMEDLSDRESGARHGASGKRSRATAQHQPRPTRDPGLRPQATSNRIRSTHVAMKVGAARWVWRREPLRLFVALSGNRGSPRRLERTAGIPRSGTHVSDRGAKTNE